MKNLIVYDSAFGNTQYIAHVMAKAIRTKALRPPAVQARHLKDLAFLVVGSPTQGGQPLPSVITFINTLPKNLLTTTSIAVFDTRFCINEHGFFIKLIMEATGFAADKLARQLQLKGGHIVGARAGFIVKDKRGPLAPGEVDEAIAWVKSAKMASSKRRRC